MRRIAFALPATIALTLAACAPSTPITTVPENLSSAFGPEDVPLRSGGTVPVVVHGHVNGLDHKALAQTAASDLQEGNWEGETHFIPGSSRLVSNGDNEYSVVMMVNGPQTITAAQLCADPAARPTSAARSNGSVSLIAALCRYDEEVTGVSARGAVQNANDPAFAQLMASAANDLTNPLAISGPESLDTDD